MSSHEIFDRRILLQRRDRVAHLASVHDFLLNRVADDFAERLAATRRQFPLVVDLGAHHGVIGRRVGSMPGVERVVSTETSLRHLMQCESPRVLADEEWLPFRDASLDLVVSGLTLHNLNDLPGALIQIRRALRPDGLLLAAVLGGQTLTELRDAFLTAESELTGGAGPHVAPFADVRDYGGLLQRAGFALPVADTDSVTVTYGSPLELMRELRGMGATNVLHSRSRSLLRRDVLSRACQVYVERFGRADGRIPATFDIITLTGWAPHESQQKPMRPGSARVRLADALGTRGHPSGPRPGSETPGSKRPP